MNNYGKNLYQKGVDFIWGITKKILHNFINLFGQNTKKHHGNHVFADFVWDVTKDNLDGEDFSDHVFGDFVFETMKKAIHQTKMTIVHSKLCILGEGDSIPGWTSVILIDESHYSSHSYTDRGLLALDIFTCGNTNPIPIMEYTIKEIKNKYPSLKCTYFQNHHRFHYY
jgi:S-adenosylmethionine/arginine decarboxylase-like enzyme